MGQFMIKRLRETCNDTWRSYHVLLLLSSKPWTKRVLSDMETLKIQTIKDVETKSKKHEHFQNDKERVYSGLSQAL